MGGLSAVLIYVLKIILIFTSFCLISVLKKVSEMSPPKKVSGISLWVPHNGII